MTKSQKKFRIQCPNSPIDKGAIQKKFHQLSKKLRVLACNSPIDKKGM